MYNKLKIKTNTQLQKLCKNTFKDEEIFVLRFS